MVALSSFVLLITCSSSLLQAYLKFFATESLVVRLLPTYWVDMN